MDTFFGNPAQTLGGGVTLTIGAYGYHHFAASPTAKWFEWVTLKGSAAYKRDLPDGLDDEKIEVCRTDLLTGSGTVSLKDACREVLPFEPIFQDTIVMDMEGRFGFKAIGSWPAFGVAPKVEYQTGDETRKLRFSAPVYFTPKDKKLTGGIGVARNVDYKDSDNSDWNVYIFFGKTFSLNGAD